MELEGLHHLTAVTGNPSVNVAFYTRVLGMRLVKKTVNQDDVSAYHLFYGDEAGNAGTEVTFFDWPHAGDRRNGAGTITCTSLRVAGTKALEYWTQRLDNLGVEHSGIRADSGRAVVAFSDPEGQMLELMDDEGRPGGRPWAGSPVPQDMGIRGLGAIRITVRALEPTSLLLTRYLGFRPTRVYTAPNRATVQVYDVGPGGPGAEVHLEVRPDIPYGRVGIGGVHHVAFRTPDDREHKAWQKSLTDAGLPVTPVIDRFYFRSIYFREPGGVLFEIATDGPGFATDESLEHLGEGLALPPFLEPHRTEIEAGLKPITAVDLAEATQAR